MDGKTMRALMEHIAEQHRQARNRNSKSGYECSPYRTKPTK